MTESELIASAWKRLQEYPLSEHWDVPESELLLLRATWDGPMLLSEVPVGTWLGGCWWKRVEPTV